MPAPVTRALWLAVGRFVAHGGFFLAAGLSFYLLVCLIPLLLFLISVTGFVLTSEAAAQAVLNQLARIVPVYREELAEILSSIVRERKIAGLVGTATLVFFATQLFSACRLVMNRAFAVRRGRGWVHGMLHDVVMIVVMGALFLGSIVLTDLLVWFKRLVLGSEEMPPVWVGVTFVTLGLLFNVALFFTAYRNFPNRHVPVAIAIWGALLASTLWEAAKQAFRWYIGSLDVYGRVYGPVAALVGLTMFAYYSAIVFVLGAEFGASLERLRRPRAGSGAGRARNVLA